MLDAATADDRSHQALPGRRPRNAPIAPAVRRRARPVLTGLLSGVAGFIVGAVFWHIVGFWSFVSQVVLKGPDEQQLQRGETGLAPPQPVKASGRLKDAARVRDLGVRAGYTQAAAGAGNCAEARMDRGSGLISLQACVLSGGPLPDGGDPRRADRLASTAAPGFAPAGWSVQVQAGD